MANWTMLDGTMLDGFRGHPWTLLDGMDRPLVMEQDIWLPLENKTSGANWSQDRPTGQGRDCYETFGGIFCAARGLVEILWTLWDLHVQRICYGVSSG